MIFVIVIGALVVAVVTFVIMSICIYAAPGEADRRREDRDQIEYLKRHR